MILLRSCPVSKVFNRWQNTTRFPLLPAPYDQVHRGEGARQEAGGAAGGNVTHRASIWLVSAIYLCPNRYTGEKVHDEGLEVLPEAESHAQPVFNYLCYLPLSQTGTQGRRCTTRGWRCCWRRRGGRRPQGRSPTCPSRPRPMARRPLHSRPRRRPPAMWHPTSEAAVVSGCTCTLLPIYAHCHQGSQDADWGSAWPRPRCIQRDGGQHASWVDCALCCGLQDVPRRPCTLPSLPKLSSK